MLNTMPDIFTIESLLIIALSAATIVLALFYHEEKTQEDLPPDEKSRSILHRAYQKAQTILGNAELEGVKVVADSKVAARNLEGKYEEELTKISEELETNFTTHVTKAEGEFVKFLDELRTRSEQMQLLSQEFTKQKVNEIFERFEQNLTNFLTSTEQKSVSAIELELRAARELVNTYKTQQMALVDENIIAMLEKTLSLVLAKKLTLSDQLDLVYEALEKAKTEKFIV